MYTPQTKEFNIEERSPPFPEPSAPPPPNYHNSDSSPVAIGIPLNSTNNQFHYPPTPNNNNNSNTFGVQSQSPVGWSTGLCDCCSDCNSCCLTYWCPCITFGRIADIVDKGSPSCCITGSIYTLLMFFTGCHCLLSCFYRTKMRGSYSLAGGSCSDCCLHCWCEQCALCQEYRELKNKGFDMSIGWHGNMERQNHARASTAPRVPGGMTR